MADFTFPKRERLKSKVLIDRLFQEGESVFVHPLKLVYISYQRTDDQSEIQIAVSVPKRKFKKAVDRNLLKRRIREAYRQNKIMLNKTLIKPQDGYAIMFVYLGKEIEEYKVIESAIKRIQKKFIRAIS